jgi:hypothetical protein
MKKKLGAMALAGRALSGTAVAQEKIKIGVSAIRRRPTPGRPG